MYKDPNTTTYHETTSTTDIVNVIRERLDGDDKKAKVFEEGMKDTENTKSMLCCYAFLHTTRE